MENNRIAPVTDNELDSLLKDAFLETDFEMSAFNRESLGLVAHHTLRGSRFSQICNLYRLDLLFLAISFFVCLNSFYRHIQITQRNENNITGPVQGINGLKKEFPRVPQAVKGTYINVSSVPVRTSALNKTTKRHSKKTTFEPLQKKELGQLLLTQPVDTSIVFTYTIQEIKINTVEDQVKKYINDVKKSAQANKPAASALRTSRETSTANRTTVKKNTLNKKNSMNRGKKMFHRKGTFILKGGRYKTSRV